MGSCDVIPNGDFIPYNGLNIIRPPSSYNKLLSPAPSPSPLPPWFDLRVFYVRITNFTVADNTPQSLTVNHIPSDPKTTLLELNGRRCSITSNGIHSILRRDRVDKKSEEVTFVSTDSVRFTGSIRFEVFDRENLVLTGTLSKEEVGDKTGKWSLKCESAAHSTGGFLEGSSRVPTLEVYVAGCFCAEPIILSKTVKIINSGRKKKRKSLKLNSSNNVKGSKLEPIPEYEAAGESVGEFQEQSSEFPSPLDSQLPASEYRDYYYYKSEKETNDEDLEHLYWGRTSKTGGYLDDLEGEHEHDEELSLFNAGIRVGVGISLGICLGVGVGVGLLASSYQKTARSFRKRRLF